MLDRPARHLLDPLLQALAGLLVRAGISANTLTFAGFALGLGASLLIALQHPLAGLTMMAVSRLLDGLDGAVARLTRPSDRGGYFDITLDFIFYASVPLAFAWAQPEKNALAAAFLLACFMGTASSFLAFAVLAEKRRQQAPHQASPERESPALSTPGKSFYFLGGLTEATETLLCFALMCLYSEHFSQLAVAFSVLCLITILTRLTRAWKEFDPTPKL